eukprot:112251-Ditylum_brightwellii.AAC.1
MHGKVLSVHNIVPQAGHSIAHNWIQALAGDITMASGIQLQGEAENLIHGRIRKPFISRYCQYYLNCTPHDRSTNTDAIIPDIIIHNYPVGSKQRINGNGTSQASTPAIFELKGIHVGKNQQDIPDEPSPFENALKTFLTSGPIPLVFGAFSEVNIEFFKTSSLAAASTEDGLYCLPLNQCMTAEEHIF